MNESRRRFLAGTVAGLVSLSLGRWSALASTADLPALRRGRTWLADEKVTLPPWTYGDTSSSTETMLMFRGNPRHTFYGTGPLPKTLSVLWKHRMEDYVTTLRGNPKVWTGTGWTGQASHLHGYVYVGSQDRHLYCFRALDGKVMWRHRGGSMFKGSLCVYRNRIYAPNVDDRLHCLDAVTGASLWTLNTGKDLDSSPCVVGDRLYIAGECGFVRCVDPETGKEHWKTEVGGTGPHTLPGSNGAEGSVAVDGGQVFVGNFDGEFTCLDQHTGKRIWKFMTGDDTDVSPVLDDEVVYVAAEEGAPHLYAIGRKDGKERWRFSNRGGWFSTPALVGERLFIGGNDGVFYCLDRNSGKAIWQVKLEAATWCSPAVVDGRVLFGTYGNHLYVLSAEDGAEVQRLDLGGRIHSAPIVVDGRVYVGTGAGTFYCLGA
jgi:outer membrane protein assembly factor BamB